MSELPINHPEKLDAGDGEILLSAHAENNPAMARQEAAVPHESSVEKQQRLAQAEAAVESTARAEIDPIKRLEAEAEREAAQRAPTPRVIDRELKNIGEQQGLRQIRRQLPARQRALSRVIHQPVIRVISETVGQSISRPSGLLGGGLVAFIGSAGYWYLAKHNGATYNYFIFLVLFGGGFVVGLILELMVYLATASTRRHHD
jgi:hypothetical protein